MTESTNQVAENTAAKSAARIGWAILIAATLYVCYFSHLGAIGFVGPDEPRYAWVARDMAETGDWVTPRLYGKPWFEKPPLFYWGAALCFKVFGVSEAAARLPSAICALLATLALAWLALRLYGAETARWLLLLLPTTVGMIGFSHAAATDMPFSGMLTIAMVAAAVVLGLIRNESTPILPRTPWLALVLFGFFLGLAVLAKGPAAIILCGGVVFFWALFTKRWRDAFRLLHPIAIATFCLIALPWYILCARRNPDFFRVFIIEHNFKRYLTPEFQHIQPFWFYLPALLVAFLPWTGALIWTTVAGSARIAKTKSLSPQTSFLLSWSLFVLLFFTLSQSKLPGYILPAVPALALLLTRGCATLAVEHRKSFGASIAAFALLCFGISEFAARPNLALNMVSQSLQLGASFLLIVIVLANVLFAAGFFCTATRWVRNLMISLCVVPVLFTFLIADELVLGLVPLSSRDLASQLLAQHVPTEQTFIYHGVSRGLRYSLSFYLSREVPDWDQNPAAEAYVVSGSVRCSQLEKQGFQCKDVPLASSAWGWFVSHVTPKTSPSSLPRSGQAQ
ncbi:MAG: ArnT family glycosyltransferase [Candidatus Acidiferrales bacterium]